MPKYTRMLCWVDKETKSEIAKVLDKNQVIFANDFEEFKNKITDKTYIVVGLTIAKENLKKFKTLLCNTSNNLRFHILLDIDFMQSDVIEAFADTGGGYRNFTLEEIIKTFNQKVQK